MYAFNRKTGARIVGTLESLSGTAVTVYEDFERNADGTLTYEHEGSTDVSWDSSETVTRPGKGVVFLDHKGEELTADQIELSEDEDWMPPDVQVRLIARKNGASSSRRARKVWSRKVDATVARWSKEGFNVWWVFDLTTGETLRQWVTSAEPFTGEQEVAHGGS